jgi:hypothetical protein
MAVSAGLTGKVNVYTPRYNWSPPVMVTTIRNCRDRHPMMGTQTFRASHELFMGHFGAAALHQTVNQAGYSYHVNLYNNFQSTTLNRIVCLWWLVQLNTRTGAHYQKSEFHIVNCIHDKILACQFT